MFKSYSPADQNPLSPDLRGAKRQYTVKGIDTDTVELMRAAAKVDGMKISSWISSRMKEAAERSLSTGAEVVDATHLCATEADTGYSYASLAEAIEAFRAYQIASEERLRKIEKEIHLITSSQMKILTKIISDD